MTTAFSTQPALVYDPASSATAGASSDSGSFVPSVGYHTIAALEQGDGSNSNTFDFSSLNELDVTVRY